MVLHGDGGHRLLHWSQHHHQGQGNHREDRVCLLEIGWSHGASTNGLNPILGAHWNWTRTESGAYCRQVFRRTLRFACVTISTLLLPLSRPKTILVSDSQQQETTSGGLISWSHAQSDGSGLYEIERKGERRRDRGRERKERERESE